ncbi:MAG: hypothetical protein AAF821_09655 [Cyanobacteria bacterium P01_D01_bin.156]
MAQLDLGTGAEQATFLPPNGSISNPVGFVGPAILQSTHTLEVKRMMAKVAVQLANDPMAMEQFCDRIHQLLRDDLQAQQERASGRRH